ncbi:hypothetical protein GOP47_0021468 [Adiantum capillus-veneris]|uniref:Uncharacterized protein n=1 Tax=Adiantum capillus-veneris TaxID=13818 RepID=A0A9D4Z7W2_ADICA|nr:hypothetical protein GOP47_0021468 [Adiantum capillus-veneris]
MGTGIAETRAIVATIGKLEFNNVLRVLEIHYVCFRDLKAPMRNFLRRLMVAFLRATLEGNKQDMKYMLRNKETGSKILKLIAMSAYEKQIL